MINKLRKKQQYAKIKTTESIKKRSSYALLEIACRYKGCIL